MTEPASLLTRNRFWLNAQYFLVALFALAGALNMLHVHLFFLTTHAADLSGPAFLYILARRSFVTGRARFPNSLVGRSPELAGAVFFLGSLGTEISQKYYPHGLFPGTYDPWDIAAYAAGVGICYLIEKAGFEISA